MAACSTYSFQSAPKHTPIFNFATSLISLLSLLLSIKAAKQHSSLVSRYFQAFSLFRKLIALIYKTDAKIIIYSKSCV